MKALHFHASSVAFLLAGAGRTLRRHASRCATLCCCAATALTLLVGCSKSDEEKMQEKKAEATAFFSELLQSNARFSNIFVQATARCHGIAPPTIEVDSVDIAAVDIVTSDGSLRCGDDYENVSELILYVHTSWHGIFEPRRDTYFRLSIPCDNQDPRRPSLYFLQSTGATDEKAVRSFIHGYQIGSDIGEPLVP